LPPASRHLNRYVPPKTASHGVWCSPTLKETGSDLHRNYHNRLCYASRLSQPLDVLIPPESLPTLFHAGSVHELLTYRGFPSPKTENVSQRPFPSCCFSPHLPHRRTGLFFVAPQLQGFEQSENPFRRTRFYPTNTDRSSPGLMPLRGFHPSGLDPVLPRSLLSWAFTSRCAANRPSRRWLCRVSKNRRVGLSLLSTADLPEVFVVHRDLRRNTRCRTS
jgi:hypothetical protein